MFNQGAGVRAGPGHEGIGMWKLALGFAVFAALAIFVLMQGGDISMAGETHSMDAAHTEAPPPAASAGAK
jgi:hypothetical protein